MQMSNDAIFKDQTTESNTNTIIEVGFDEEN